MHKSWLLAICAVLAASAPTHAQELGDARSGLAYARAVCAECHAVASELRSPDPGARTFTEIANTPGMTGLALKVWFQSPHPTMPNFIIEPDHRDDLVAYILGLRDKR